MRRAYKLALFLLLSAIVCPSLHAASVKINGISYISLNDVAGRLGMKFKWLRPQEQAQLSSQWSTLTFKDKKRVFTINDIQVWLGNNLRSRNNKLYVSEADYKGVIAPILAPKTIGKQKKLRRIVLDAGHGGKDVGTSNAGLSLREKDMTLDLSLRLKAILEKLGYQIILTRSNDRFIQLKERPTIANKKNADLFISLHFNSVEKGGSRVDGIETYALTLKDHPSTSTSTVTLSDRKHNPGNASDGCNSLIGYYLQKSLTHNMNATDRGLKRARFAVLRSLNCPGILVEAGFMSNNPEARKIKTAKYRQRLALSIAKGIQLYDKTLQNLHS